LAVICCSVLPSSSRFAAQDLKTKWWIAYQILKGVGLVKDKMKNKKEDYSSKMKDYGSGPRGK